MDTMDFMDTMDAIGPFDAGGLSALFSVARCVEDA